MMHGVVMDIPAAQVPLASVIVTNHNYGRYVAEAIRSALAQTWPRVEVIVVDDGSTDNSRAVIESFGERVVAIFKTQGGQGSATNAGFAHSRGEIVVFLDADDVLLPGAVALHAERLQAPGVVKSCGFMTVVDDAGRPTGHRVPHRLPPSGNYREESLARGIDIFPTSFTSAHAWSRDFLERVMPLPEDDVVGVDGYLTAIDRFFGRLEFVREPVVLYRRHDANRGPISQRLDLDYMRKRVASKRFRIALAADWAERLGLSVDRREFTRLRSWRLALMEYVVGLAEGPTRIGHPLREYLSSPLGNPNRPRWRAWSLTLLLAVVRSLPARSATLLAGYVLWRSTPAAVRPARPPRLH